MRYELRNSNFTKNQLDHSATITQAKFSIIDVYFVHIITQIFSNLVIKIFFANSFHYFLGSFFSYTYISVNFICRITCNIIYMQYNTHLHAYINIRLSVYYICTYLNVIYKIHTYSSIMQKLKIYFNTSIRIKTMHFSVFI